MSGRNKRLGPSKHRSGAGASRKFRKGSSKQPGLKLSVSWGEGLQLSITCDQWGCDHSVTLVRDENKVAVRSTCANRRPPLHELDIESLEAGEDSPGLSEKENNPGRHTACGTQHTTTSAHSSAYRHDDNTESPMVIPETQGSQATELDPGLYDTYPKCGAHAPEIHYDPAMPETSEDATKQAAAMLRSK